MRGGTIDEFYGPKASQPSPPRWTDAPVKDYGVPDTPAEFPPGRGEKVRAAAEREEAASKLIRRQKLRAAWTQQGFTDDQMDYLESFAETMFEQGYDPTNPRELQDYLAMLVKKPSPPKAKPAPEKPKSRMPRTPRELEDMASANWRKDLEELKKDPVKNRAEILRLQEDLDEFDIRRAELDVARGRRELARKSPLTRWFTNADRDDLEALRKDPRTRPFAERVAQGGASLDRQRNELIVLAHNKEIAKVFEETIADSRHLAPWRNQKLTPDRGDNPPVNRLRGPIRQHADRWQGVYGFVRNASKAEIEAVMVSTRLRRLLAPHLEPLGKDIFKDMKKLRQVIYDALDEDIVATIAGQIDISRYLQADLDRLKPIN